MRVCALVQGHHRRLNMGGGSVFLYSLNVETEEEHVLGCVTLFQNEITAGALPIRFSLHATTAL